MSGSTAIVFDAYGTLFDVQSVSAAAEALFPGHGAALTQLWRTRQLEYTWLRALMGRYADFWQVTGEALAAAAAQLHLELDAAGRQGLLEQYQELVAYPEAPVALQTLRKAGVKLAILSNGAPAMLAAAVAHAGLEPLLDAVLSADAVKTYKPDPRVYSLAPSALGVDKEQVLFISSNHWDIAGASAFGFRTAWINRAGNPPEQLGQTAAHELRRLTEVPALLQL